MYFGDRYATPGKAEIDDRRTVMRRHLIYYLRVWNLKSKKLLGHIVDINSGGFMLISEKEIKPGQNFDLEIRWKNPDDQEIKIRFKAESRWSSNDVNPSFYDTGFQLIGSDEKVLKPIHKMIEEYGFPAD
jgi:hypothetical protein